MREDIFVDSKIKAIIFDVGGVLVLGGKPRPTSRELHISGVHQKIAKKLNLSLDQYFDSIDTAYAKSMEGHISKSVLMDTLSFNLGQPQEKLKNLFVKTYRSIYKKNKKLFLIANKLKKQGYTIAILSDQWHLSKEALMEKKDFQIFDKQVVSCDEGMRKPNHEIYKLILKKLNLKPEQTIFIDNQTWNLVPAQKLGMKTILFTDNKKLREQLKNFGVYVR